MKISILYLIVFGVTKLYILRRGCTLNIYKVDVQDRLCFGKMNNAERCKVCSKGAS